MGQTGEKMFLWSCLLIDELNEIIYGIVCQGKEGSA